MRKIDVLAWGMKHIASNHGFEAYIDFEERGYVIIDGYSVPTLSDVQMMCEDLGIPREAIDYDRSWEWISVDVYRKWTQEGGPLQKEYSPTGTEMWKRKDAIIGN